MARRIVIALVLSFGLLCSMAAETYANISEAAVLFLRIAAGARPAGMGEAFVAIADDATATHWNPAGLGRYPLSDLWLSVELPDGMEMGDFAVVENGVPEMNYAHYDVWVVTKATEGHPAELLRATPPSPSMIGSKATTKWERGDVYEPDASEELVSLVRSRTGLVDGPELDERVRQVAELNQVVSTDSLRAWWEGLQELPGATIDDSLVLAYDELLAANDVLNVDPDGLRDVLDEMAQVVKDGSLTEDELYGLRVLIRRRAIVTYLPEELEFPFSFNLTGEVTAIAANKQTLWVGTTKGLLRKSGDRWTALNDSLAGPAAGVIHDIAIAPSGAMWVATDEGVSRFTSSWAHLGSDHAWKSGPCKQVFVLGENRVFASDGSRIYRWDETSGLWDFRFSYTANIGENMKGLIGSLLDVTDPVQVKALTDSLVVHSGVSPEALEAGSKLIIPYGLGLRGEVLSMAETSDHTLWFGTTRGLVSLSPKGQFRHYGYAREEIKAPTTVQAVAEKYVGPGNPDRAARLAERIKADNDLDADALDSGRVISVYTTVRGAAIHSLFADGNSLLIGTEFGMVEHSGNDWYRYLHEGLENSRVRSIAERSGERWFASDKQIAIYAHPRKELSLMHVKWLPELANDLYYEYLAYVTHIKGWGTVGANITFISLGTQYQVNEFNQPLGEFGTFEVAGTLSYGTKISKTLATGLSAKVIYSHLSDVGTGAERGSGTATGFAVDLGAIWQTPIDRLTLGAAITNLGPDISYIDANQADPLPRNLALGFAYRFINSAYSRLTLVGEMNKDLIGVTDALSAQADEAIFNGGLEYQYASLIALRAGYVYDRQGEIKTPTVGLGLQYKNYLLDFAYIPSSDTQVLANTTRLAASIRF